MLLCRTELAVSLGHKPSTTVQTAVVQSSCATQPPRCYTFPCKGTCHGSVLQWRLWAWVTSFLTLRNLSPTSSSSIFPYPF